MTNSESSRLAGIVDQLARRAGTTPEELQKDYEAAERKRLETERAAREAEETRKRELSARETEKALAILDLEIFPFKGRFVVSVNGKRLASGRHHWPLRERIDRGNDLDGPQDLACPFCGAPVPEIRAALHRLRQLMQEPRPEWNGRGQFLNGFSVPAWASNIRCHNPKCGRELRCCAQAIVV